MEQPPKPTYFIEGVNFADFVGFIEECNRGFIRSFGGEWHGNLDALNDYFSWHAADYILIWRNSGKSRRDLGYPAMAIWLEHNLHACHPSNVEGVLGRLQQAQAKRGQTLFELLVEIIHTNHNVELRLE